MNREIKFRGWNTATKTMLDLKAITPLALDSRLQQDGVFIPFDEQVELMQFTGILDKTGKEIYEDDVVVQDCYIWFDDGQPNYRATVEWIYSQWQVVAHCINPAKQGISDGINQGLNDEGVDEGEKSDWRVIGNIFENPELLEQEMTPGTSDNAPKSSDVFIKDEATGTDMKFGPAASTDDATDDPKDRSEGLHVNACS